MNHPALETDASVQDASTEAAVLDAATDTPIDEDDASSPDVGMEDARVDASEPDASLPAFECRALGEGEAISLCISRERMTHHTAQRACESIEGNLMMINEAGIQEKVLTVLQGMNVNARFGLRRTDTQREFHWRDGSPLGDYSNWATGQPTREVGEYACAYIRSSDGGWFDTPCYAELPFLCEPR